jgi:hypothetical protein
VVQLPRGEYSRSSDDIATSLESAQARAQELAVRSPGDYLVLDLETGNKHFLKLGSVDESADNRRTEVGNHG